PVMTATTEIDYRKSCWCWLESIVCGFFRLAVGVHFTARSTSEVEVPNPHVQTPRKRQITMTKPQRVVEALAAASAYLLGSAFGTSAATTFDICSLEIFWDLGFGIWCL